MGPERSYWPSSHFRHVMLMQIGDAIKDYYTTCHEPLPENVRELLKRLDDNGTQDGRSGGRGPSFKAK